MHADIIPCEASFGTEALTYAVGDSFHSRIRVGQLTLIPYGKKQILGIVARIYPAETSRSDIRDIHDILSNAPVLAEYHIALIERIALKYLLPIHRVCSIFLPIPLIRRLQKQQFPLIEHIPPSSHSPNEIILFRDSPVTANHLASQLMAWVVIIVPDDIFLEQIRSQLESTHHSLLFLPNDITDTRRAQSWIDIAQKKYDSIIWTRRLLTYNLAGYREIWYVEDAFSTEYFHYPVRIQYTDMLAHIADSECFHIKILTSIPRLKTLSQFHYFTLRHL